MSNVLDRNIQTLLEQRQKYERNKSRENRVADAITGFTGSMTFVYIHLFLYGTWIIWNLGYIGLEPFDPTFVVLAMAASVEAIFLSTFVLISQNRSNAMSDKRAELDLQISLLTEHEVTRLITMLSAVAKKLGVEEAQHPDIEELSKDVKPEKVMETIESADEKRKT